MKYKSENTTAIKKRISVLKIVLMIIAVLIFAMGVGSIIYVSDYYHSTYTLKEYQQNYNATSTEITEKDSVITLKGETDNGIGIIFYPGGKVEYTAYIPLLELMAEKGYTCFIPKMPGNLAVFGVNKADKIIKQNTDINEWYIAGHSLGGAMASAYASKNSTKLKGIIFMGAYPSSDLSQTKLKMLSIVGSNDEVINRDSYENAKGNAPADAIYITLEGGNHSGYGDYGPQDGDGTAAITGEEQKEKTAGWIEEFCMG